MICLNTALFGGSVPRGFNQQDPLHFTEKVTELSHLVIHTTYHESKECYFTTIAQKGSVDVTGKQATPLYQMINTFPEVAISNHEALVELIQGSPTFVVKLINGDIEEI